MPKKMSVPAALLAAKEHLPRELQGLIDRKLFVWGYDKPSAVNILLLVAGALLFLEGLAVQNGWARAVAWAASLVSCWVWFRKWRERKSALLIDIEQFPPQDLPEAAKHNNADLIRRQNDYALVDKQLNEVIGTTPISIQLLRKPYVLPSDTQHFINHIFSARKTSWDTVNESKARIASRFDAAVLGTDPAVRLQKTDYYSGLLTHELGKKRFQLKNAITSIDPTRYFIKNGRIIPLDQSQASNHLGATTIALTADRRFVIQRETEGAEGIAKLAASGSGSLDWDDIGKAKDQGLNSFQEILAFGMERELTEETGVPKGTRCFTAVTGMARLINRGGKPDFYGATLLDTEFRKLSISKRERRYTWKLFHRDVKTFAKADIIEELDSMISEYRETNGVGMPLYLTLIFAREWYCTLGDGDVERWFAGDDGILGARKLRTFPGEELERNPSPSRGAGL